ncbi:MAG TPA: aminotransferase class I/II-fold pyridoxal phosphate-dependent enzyme [Pseudogracilibacillus sp.]|nr:aminotransferase class I/II-fold pyridoxal phosphate-dependent enzyme [Pseudogracilibacillus sp.]
MAFQPADRMNQFPESIFGKLKEAAAKKAATGKELYDLSIGSPDLAPDQLVQDTLAKESSRNDAYGYTLGGIPAFQEAVADYYKRRSQVQLNPETEILQTLGSQEGLIHLPLAFCNEEDIVLTTNPAYVAYDVGIKLANAKSYKMPLKEENNFLPDLSAIPESIAKNAKLLILNLPGNPVPAMPTQNFFEEVVQFAKMHNILVLHDAAYSEYYFEGDGPMSFLATPGAKDIGVEINSLSKSFSMAGARIAYIVGNDTAIRIMKDFKSNLDYGIFEPIQAAAVTALNNAETITDRLRATFKERHKLLTKGLQDLGWKVAPSNGGMFIWAKYPNDLNDQDFVLKLIQETGVIMVPGSAFGSEGEGYVRIALVQESETLQQALKALKTFK